MSVRRTHLDHQMALRAVDLGVELCEGHRVRGVQGNEIFGDGFRCEARVIVAADGTHSLLARQARLVVPVARLDRIGFSAHVRPDREVPSGEVHMFAGFGRTSTAGGFSMQGDGTGILSCVLPKSQANMLAGRLHEFASDLMKEWLGMNGEILDAQSTHCFGHKLRQVFTENTLFVGDAARFVDPFTGEGIHHALVGAELAAEVASDALHQGEISIRTLSRYDTMRRELDARYRLSDLVQSVVHSDGLVRRVSSRLKERPASAKKLFATLTDSKPPHAVMNPKTLWEVFGL